MTTAMVGSPWSEREARLSPAARALLALLRPAEATGAPPLTPPYEGEWEPMVELALRHGVAPLLHRSLGARAPASRLEQLARERRATALVNLRNYGELARIGDALREKSIDLIALKGLHLAELVYRDISLRPMSDLDILVRPEQLETAVAALRALGYGFDAELPGAASAMLHAKCNIGLAHRQLDIWLEVHWSLDEPPQGCVAAVDEMWASALPGRLADRPALVSSPESLLLHVCAHLACNHAFAFSLRALCDIAEIVEKHPDLDWRVIVEQGERNAWTSAIAAALALAKDHLGAKVPQEALDSLGAASLDPELLADALQHLIECIEMPAALLTAPKLLASVSVSPLGAAALLWQRLFVSRAELALLYGVSQRSARLPIFYFVRMRDLLRRYAAGAWALKVSDPNLAAAAARHRRLADWVRTPGREKA